MKVRLQPVGRAFALACAAVLGTAALIVAGCTANSGLTGSTTSISTTTTPVPISLTDAPADPVVAASLTLNSIVLTDAKGASTSLLTAPFTFEATHLDAVQEPLFTPAVPEDTYTSVALTYSNAVVDYVDPATQQLVIADATLANTSQTITFSTPITINNTMTSLLVDFLVANSVNISGSTVTVTPAFNIAAAPVPAQPTNGTNGLQCGVKGKISALGSNQFTLVNGEGLSLAVDVNNNTQYQGPGLTGFANLAVNMLVEVDLQTQADGSLLALRVEEQVPANATAELLVGPVIAVSGSPATTFTQVVRQQIGPPPTTTPIAKDTITVNSSTTFELPGRWQNLATIGLPFTPTFNASTLFAGQVVAVDSNGVSNNAATAVSVELAPQTVAGTITAGAMPTCTPCWGTFTLTLPSNSWLATVTGQSTVTVYVSSTSVLETITSTPPGVSSVARFNGYLFNHNGGLALIALVIGPGPGTPIGPTP